MSGRQSFSVVRVLVGVAVGAMGLAALGLWSSAATNFRVKTVQCSTNLHDIAMALKMYSADNRLYPETLGGYVQTDKSGKVIPFERTKSALYPTYLKSVKSFHCPTSPNTDTDSVVEIRTPKGLRKYYAYDSYDVFTPEYSKDMLRAGPESLRYCRLWAATESDVAKLPVPNDSEKLQAYDYQRQLYWMRPPGDTVVTWCSYHAKQQGVNRVQVLFLDGHSDRMDPVAVEGSDGRGGSRWRTQPHD